MQRIILIAIVVTIALAAAYQLRMWVSIMREKVRIRRSLGNAAGRVWQDARFCFALGHLLIDVGLTAMMSTWAVSLWLFGPRAGWTFRTNVNFAAAVLVMVAKFVFIWASALERDTRLRFWRFLAITAVWLIILTVLVLLN